MKKPLPSTQEHRSDNLDAAELAGARGGGDGTLPFGIAGGTSRLGDGTLPLAGNGTLPFGEGTLPLGEGTLPL